MNGRLWAGDMARQRWLVALGTIAVVVSVIVGYAEGGGPASWGALLVIGIIACFLRAEWNIAAYLLLLAVQVPFSAFAFRVALSDVFLLPAVLKSAPDMWARRRQSTLRAPILVLLAAMGIASVVGFVRTGSLSRYALFNKGAGVVFLAAGLFVIQQHVRNVRDVRRLTRWFVGGVSIANLLALLAVALAFAGIDNSIYMSNNRLYGWLLNPSSYGSVVLTAALLELSTLTRCRRSTRPILMRWANLAGLIIAVMFTLSRSSWVALAVGALTVIALNISRIPRWHYRGSTAGLTAAILAAVVPISLLGTIAFVQWNSIRSVDPAAVAAGQVERLVRQCVINPNQNPELCKQIPPQLMADAKAGKLSGGPVALAGNDTAAKAGKLSGGPVALAGNDTALFNARGLGDRTAILDIAWHSYTATWSTKLWGIGLGVFLQISALRIGVPLIIHNTFAWFLVEMGPFGLAALLWVLVRTGANLRAARTRPDWSLDLRNGVAAGLVAWLSYSLLNEAFYARHFWFLMLCADGLYVQSRAQHTVATDKAAASAL